MACFALPQEGAEEGLGGREVCDDGRHPGTCKRLETFVFLLLPQASQRTWFLFTKPDIVRVTACNDLRARLYLKPASTLCPGRKQDPTRQEA